MQKLCKYSVNYSFIFNNIAHTEITLQCNNKVFLKYIKDMIFFTLSTII